MKKSLGAALAVFILVALAVANGAAQKSAPADVQLKAAITKEVVDGDLKAAIEMYRTLSQGADRAVAAKALLRLGQCYEKLGDTESRKAYERLVRDFSDQKEIAEQARARLATLGPRSSGAPPVASARLYWTGRYPTGPTSASLDGRYLAQIEPQTGELLLHDLLTGDSRRLTNDASPTARNQRPVISPDGKIIAYQRVLSTADWEIRIVGRSDPKPRVLSVSQRVRFRCAVLVARQPVRVDEVSVEDRCPAGLCGGRFDAGPRQLPG
jgi:tetratricopeptide (TPR) repeat protein